jgi:heterokaryon incompatibility protein (HET)
MTGLWDLLTTATNTLTSTRNEETFPTPLLEANELDAHSGRRPVHPAVCSKCAELSKSIAIALDNLPSGFDDIFSDAPTYLKVADVGSSYRTWVNMRRVVAALMLLLYDVTIGPFRPVCNLCRMLSTALIWNPDGRDTITDELRLVRLNTQLVYRGAAAEWEYDALRRGSPLLLTVMEKDIGLESSGATSVEGRCRVSGCTIVRRRGSPVMDAICQPRLVGSRFDTEMAREWLKYCQNHHRGPCLSNIEMVTGLCLIDCRSRTVVAAPADARYVALSYCWGQPSSPRWFQWWTRTASVQEPIVHSDADGDGVVCRLPAEVPAVISDAMLVTTSMGFSYLWVDRYCINQNSAAKHVQISQMDSIYQKAELTVIAAAGETPSYGLPGVGLRPRRRQLTCSVGDLDFWSTMSHPHETLQSSPWFKRAWTFQEGLLSRRRLVFTDEQVFYECAAMNCRESMLNDLDSLHTEDRTKFRECLKSGFFGSKNNFLSTGGFGEVSRTPEDNMRRLGDMIELYTDRDLTYDTDSLNAFVGILRFFEHSESPIATIWGVPLRRTLNAEGEDLVEQTNASFVASLAWKHEQGSTAYLFPIYPRRRDGFPSWSWCGWQGGIGCERFQFNSVLRFVALEDSAGAVFTPTEYLDHIDQTQSYVLRPSILWITGFVVPQTAFSVSRAEDDTSDECRIFGFKSAYAYMSIGPWDKVAEHKSFAEDESRRCVCLGDSSDHKSVTFLVLERHEGDWQRIGRIWLYMQPVDGGRPRREWEVITDDQPWQFWKSWLDYETKSSVPLDEVWDRIPELPVTSFRII